MADDGVQKTKRCTSCGGDDLLEFFRPGKSTNGNPSLNLGTQCYRDRCLGCEALRKHGEPLDQRLRRKAIAARRRHGIKLKVIGRIKDENDLEEVYGWSLDRMVDDIERIKEKGCPYCMQPVDTDGQGLGIITLDILNTDQAPHYSTNVIWCCSSCNSEKQRTSPEIWGARQSMWRRWRLNQIRLGADQEAFGFLQFDNNKADPPALW